MRNLWQWFKKESKTVSSKPAHLFLSAFCGAVVGVFFVSQTSGALERLWVFSLASVLTGIFLGEIMSRQDDGVRVIGGIWGGLGGLIISVAIIMVWFADVLFMTGPLLLLASLFLFLRKKSRGRKARRAVEEEVATRAERDKLIAKITKLTSNSEIAAGFLHSVELLTRYVPDLGVSLLEAAKDDTERYLMLGSLIASTDNDVLKRDSQNEQAAIATSLRETVVKLTTEALMAVEAAQSAEAEKVLGVRVPRLAEAGKELDFYLAGLREAREATEPAAAIDALASEIGSLSPEKAKELEIRELPTSDSRMRLGRGK